MNTIIKKINIVIPVSSKLAFTTKFIAVTIVPGPARIGMANGEIANPSSKVVSLSKWIDVFFD
jgi:hypothetical protein